MVNDYNLLMNPKPSYRRVFTAGSQVLTTKAIGDVHIQTGTGEVLLTNVLYVPKLNVKLLSTNSLTDEGARVILDSEGGKIHMADGTSLRVLKNRARGLLEFTGEISHQASAFTVDAGLFEGVDLEFEDVKSAPKPSAQQIWHERLGHPGRDKTRKLIEYFKGNSEVKLDPETPLECECCIQAKSTRSRMGKGSGERATGPMDLLHVDLVVDSSGESEYGYTLVVVDDCSQYVYAQPLTHKSHAFEELRRIILFLETQNGKRVKAIRSDQGGEWASDFARTWALERGIAWQKTIAYTSEQNGRAERMNRTLAERMRTLLIQRRMPKRFWPFAMRAAAFKINLSPNAEGRIPFEVMFGKSANRFGGLLRVFGCLAWVNIPKVKRHHKKLDSRAVPAIFLGYSLERKGWLFYSPDYQPNLFWSNSARFLEHRRWDERAEWRPMEIKAPKVPTSEDDVADLGYTDKDVFEESDAIAIEEMVDWDGILGDELGNEPAELQEGPAEEERSPSPVHESMQSASPVAQGEREASPVSTTGGTMGSEDRDLAGPVSTSADFSIRDNELILRRKHEAVQSSEDEWRTMAEFYRLEKPTEGLPARPADALEDPGDYNTWDPKLRRGTTVNLRNPASALAAAQQPTPNLSPTLREAEKREDWPQWQEAMRKEYLGLEAMGTWEVADLPHGAHTVDTKWVLKIKTDADMVPTKYKARLVARGFTQREGIDYEEIFAPVAPLDAIRGVVAVAAVNDWEIDCIDVVQAYLNSSLHHDVYLKPPAGFSDKVPPGKVLKLKKGLYGLKQSGREWNQELDRHLRRIGFHAAPSAPCIYTRGMGDKITVITAYVDDMMIASPSRAEVDRTKQEIRDKWKIEDNGPIKEFLGVKVVRDRAQRKIALDQSAYIRTMVSKWLPKNEKTWCPLAGHLDVEDSQPCERDQGKHYQELVGQLLWVANTVRPDISFAVGTLARYMSNPKVHAWEAALKVLKYLNQTVDNHLVLGENKDMERAVVTYTDSNWASDKATGRRSTSGSMTFIYGCLVSWKSHVQKCVALSAVEAELVAASEASREALFFSYLLRDLGRSNAKPLLLTDSRGCLQVSKDPAKHWKLKHIDTRYFFVRDHVQEGDVHIEFVGTAMNVSDMLTKPLAKVPLSEAGVRIGLVRPLRGGVEDTSGRTTHTGDKRGLKDGDQNPSAEVTEVAAPASMDGQGSHNGRALNTVAHGIDVQLSTAAHNLACLAGAVGHMRASTINNPCEGKGVKHRPHTKHRPRNAEMSLHKWRDPSHLYHACRRAQDSTSPWSWHISSSFFPLFR